MNDVLQVADRVDALYLGRLAAEVRTADSSVSQIVRAHHDRALRVDWPCSRYGRREHVRDEARIDRP